MRAGQPAWLAELVHSMVQSSQRPPCQQSHWCFLQVLSLVERLLHSPSVVLLCTVAFAEKVSRLRSTGLYC
jgi:hypothetical protein